MYRDIAPELLQIVEPVVKAHGLELVDVQRSGVPGRGLRLRVILDTVQGDGKVTVGECSKVSKEVGHGLDAASSMASHAYLLEVCSPGVDRTLGRWVDFERVVGREVSVETRAPVDGRRRFRGELRSCADGHLEVVLPEGLQFRIPFAEVAKGKAYHGGDAKAKR